MLLPETEIPHNFFLEMIKPRRHDVSGRSSWQVIGIAVKATRGTTAPRLTTEVCPSFFFSALGCPAQTDTQSGLIVVPFWQALMHCL